MASTHLKKKWRLLEPQDQVLRFLETEIAEKTEH